MKPRISKGATPPCDAGTFAGEGGIEGVWARRFSANNIVITAKAAAVPEDFKFKCFIKGSMYP
jgi:hypothetical protein